MAGSSAERAQPQHQRCDRSPKYGGRRPLATTSLRASSLMKGEMSSSLPRLPQATPCAACISTHIGRAAPPKFLWASPKEKLRRTHEQDKPCPHHCNHPQDCNSSSPSSNIYLILLTLSNHSAGLGS